MALVPSDDFDAFVRAYSLYVDRTLLKQTVTTDVDMFRIEAMGYSMADALGVKVVIALQRRRTGLVVEVSQPSKQKRRRKQYAN